MNDDCDTGNCTRPVKESPAIKGYKFMTGRLLVDNDILYQAQSVGNTEVIDEYREMYGSLN